MADVAEVVMSVFVCVPGHDKLNVAIGVLSGSSVFGHVVDSPSIDLLSRMAN